MIRTHGCDSRDLASVALTAQSTDAAHQPKAVLSHTAISNNLYKKLELRTELRVNRTLLNYQTGHWTRILQTCSTYSTYPTQSS